MTRLADFPITKRWPPRDPAAIQYYGFPTPNGLKVSIMLEETGLPYDAHTVSFAENAQFSPEFLAISPNNKIPAIIDPQGPGGAPLPLFESGAILIYLAEKTGQLLPADPAGRYDVLQWLMFQMGGIGPMFGQMGFFVKMGGKDVADPIPRERYVQESIRLLKVLDRQLDGRDWVCGDYSIADIAICPWLRTVTGFYEAGPLVGWDTLANVPAYLDRFMARPAVQRGLLQPPRG
ncbi:MULTISPECIES: glutathione S-transferase family protein [Actibacterium]|uniref:GST-like protein n=1 Tax=Actibacterium naphthalenivorans TaxID=1614693 RepID=A0A840C9F2_9RHOB|nr:MULTISPECIES: glutathione S-transferase N-terminal domain-containing protein [Actibacterium]ALG91277.1 glutathione S-transferase [Actibacterium sp. EMB200-NS6]MBB4022654.1 GST-like protein [Actibacterium naphthalenivorans]